MTLLIIFIWFTFGFLTYGVSLAYFQHNYPSISKGCYKGDVLFSFFVGFIGGPFGFVSFFLSYFLLRGRDNKFQGFMYRNPHK